MCVRQRRRRFSFLAASDPICSLLPLPSVLVSNQAQQGRSNFLCPVFRRDSVTEPRAATQLASFTRNNAPSRSSFPSSRAAFKYEGSMIVPAGQGPDYEDFKRLCTGKNPTLLSVVRGLLQVARPRSGRAGVCVHDLSSTA